MCEKKGWVWMTGCLRVEVVVLCCLGGCVWVGGRVEVVGMWFLGLCYRSGALRQRVEVWVG